MRILALVLAMMPAFATATTADDWISYESDEHQFSISLPSEPILDSSPKAGIAAAFAVSANGPPAGADSGIVGSFGS